MTKLSDKDKALFESAIAALEDDEPEKDEAVKTSNKPKKKDKEERLNSPFANALKEVKVKQSRRSVDPKPKQKKPSEPAKRKEFGSEEDAYRQAIAGAAPLKERTRIPLVKEKREQPLIDDEAEVMAELADLIEGSGFFETSFHDEHIEGLAKGIDRTLLKKLKKGSFSVRAHLDLHGLTRIEAKERVERFILENRQKQNRCVLIVHGRGLHSKDGIPVLKQAVTSWLLRGRIAKSVLAFCSARPCDGGLGAIVVLLRR